MTERSEGIIKQGSCRGLRILGFFTEVAAR